MIEIVFLNSCSFVLVKTVWASFCCYANFWSFNWCFHSLPWQITLVWTSWKQPSQASMKQLGNSWNMKNYATLSICVHAQMMSHSWIVLRHNWLPFKWVALPMVVRTYQINHFSRLQVWLTCLKRRFEAPEPLSDDVPTLVLATKQITATPYTVDNLTKRSVERSFPGYWCF